MTDTAGGFEGLLHGFDWDLREIYVKAGADINNVIYTEKVHAARQALLDAHAQVVELRIEAAREVVRQKNARAIAIQEKKDAESELSALREDLNLADGMIRNYSDTIKIREAELTALREAHAQVVEELRELNQIHVDVGRIQAMELQWKQLLAERDRTECAESIRPGDTNSTAGREPQ